MLENTEKPIKIRVAHLFSVLCSPNYVSLRFGLRVVISAYKRWLVRSLPPVVCKRALVLLTLL
jgi:predicted MarR family transcription regulator